MRSAVLSLIAPHKHKEILRRMAFDWTLRGARLTSLLEKVQGTVEINQQNYVEDDGLSTHVGGCKQR